LRTIDTWRSPEFEDSELRRCNAYGSHRSAQDFGRLREMGPGVDPLWYARGLLIGIYFAETFDRNLKNGSSCQSATILETPCIPRFKAF
jgi:hypothetical protein